MAVRKVDSVWGIPVGNGILSKVVGHRSAALLELSFFYGYFSGILLAGTGRLVSAWAKNDLMESVE